MENTAKKTFKVGDYVGFGGYTPVFYISIAIAVFALISSFTYYLYDYGDKTFSSDATLLMWFGALSFLLCVFTKTKTAPAIPALLYTIGAAKALEVTLPSLSDVWNGVHFIGGFGKMGLFFTVQFAVCAVASIICCFFNYRKVKETTNEEK